MPLDFSTVLTEAYLKTSFVDISELWTLPLPVKAETFMSSDPEPRATLFGVKVRGTGPAEMG